MTTDEQRAFEKSLRDLRQKVKKLRDRKGNKHIEELAYWGLAHNELTSLMQQLRYQREDSAAD
ncbi:MAG: hypothetical protein GY811_04090 [Myxococcales bacterium]|nr:hypothetical protein [Myxococcales bacterium]